LRPTRPAPSDPARSVFGSTGSRPLELSKDCGLSAAPVRAQGYRRSVPPVPPLVATTGFGIVEAALPMPCIRSPSTPPAPLSRPPSLPSSLLACSARIISSAELHVSCLGQSAYSA